MSRSFRLLAIVPTILVVAVAAGPVFARPHHDRPGAPAAPPASTAAPFTVAVFGEGFADALAEGLRLDLGDAGIGIVAVTHAFHGLAREPRFDWTAAATALLSARRIDAAVIMLGESDLAPMKDGTAMVEPRSARWRSLYAERVAQLAAPFAARKVPLTWVGLPIVADEEAAAGHVELNGLIRDAVARAGADYVDVWNGFADEAGRFDAMGPDRDGRRTKLRTADGRGFTGAGAVKLASFIAKDLRRQRLLSQATQAAARIVVLPPQPDFDNDVNAQIRRELGLSSASAPLVNGQGAVPSALVTDPPAAVDGQLVTQVNAPAPVPGTGGSLAQRTLDEGQPLAPRPGRIDDFSWPRR